MAYIESHQSLGNNPKTNSVAESLKINPAQVVGHLQYLWWWALDYAQDGDLTDFSARQVADACRWKKEPAPFIAALLSCGVGNKAGFLELTRGHLLIHDWPEYAGKLISKRRADADRKRKQREADVHGMSAGHPPDGAAPSMLPVARTAQVEKSREEKTNVEERSEEEQGAFAPAASSGETAQAVDALKAAGISLNRIQLEDVAERVAEGLSAASFRFAAGKARANGVSSYGYLKPILDECAANGGPPALPKRGRQAIAEEPVDWAVYDSDYNPETKRIESGYMELRDAERKARTGATS